jgi:hypothetical protein
MREHPLLPLSASSRSPLALSLGSPASPPVSTGGHTLLNTLTVTQASRLLNGSTPLENSSIKTTGRSPIRAIARLNFRWFPPDSDVARLLAFGSNPAADNSVETSCPSILEGTPLRRPYSHRCWRTVTSALAKEIVAYP